MQKSTIAAKIDKVENIAVDKIGSVLFNFRSQRKVKEDIESEDFEQLKLSIEKQGIVYPIYLTPANNGTYSIVDGSRRLEAVRQLGRKEIKAFILEGLTELELLTIAISQNINRINLSVEEKINTIIQAAKVTIKGKDGGIITEEEIKAKAKQVHNFETHVSDTVDKVFKNLIERLGLSGVYVYKLLQTKLQIAAKAFDKANEVNLPLPHRILLTNKQLKITDEDKKPGNEKDYNMKEQRQLELIDSIKGTPLDLARRKVDLYIESIEQTKDLLDYDPDTVTTEAVGEKYIRRSQGEDEVVRDPALKYVDIMVAIQEFLKQGTGVQLRKGQPYYKKENIEYTEDYRKAMIDSIIALDAKALKIELYNATRVINSFIDLIEAKYPKELDKYK